VNRAIQFYDDATFRTVKVGNVRTYSMLPAEPLAELATLKILPELSFRGCRLLTQSLAILGRLSEVVDFAATVHRKV
jgi:hypothetical protein